MMFNQTKKSGFILFFTLLLFILVPVTMSAQSGGRAIQPGGADKAFTSKNYRLASEICQAEIKQGVATVNTYIYLCESLYFLNDFNGVIREYANSVKVGKSHSKIRQIDLLALFKSGRNESAIKQFEYLSGQKNQFTYRVVYAYFFAGEYYLKNKDYHQAYSVLSEALIQHRYAGAWWQEQMVDQFAIAVAGLGLTTEIVPFYQQLLKGSLSVNAKKKVQLALKQIEKAKSKPIVTEAEILTPAVKRNGSGT